MNTKHVDVCIYAGDKVVHEFFEHPPGGDQIALHMLFEFVVHIRNSSSTFRVVFE